MEEYRKKKRRTGAQELTGALGESVKEYLKKAELPGERAAAVLNSFYPADAGTLVQTLEEIGGREKKWDWGGGSTQGTAGKPQMPDQNWGRETGYEEKVELVRQALQREKEAHRRQEGNYYSPGNRAGQERETERTGQARGNPAAPGAGDGEKMKKILGRAWTQGLQALATSDRLNKNGAGQAMETAQPARARRDLPLTERWPQPELPAAAPAAKFAGWEAESPLWMEETVRAGDGARTPLLRGRGADTVGQAPLFQALSLFGERSSGPDEADKTPVQEVYEPSSHKRDRPREWGEQQDHLVWNEDKKRFLPTNEVKEVNEAKEEKTERGKSRRRHGLYWGDGERERAKLSPELRERYDKEMDWLRENRSDPAHDHVAPFVEKHYAIALRKEEETGIPAEFMIAQLALESGWGKHLPPEDSHNYGGIRGSEDNPGPAGIVTAWSEEDQAYVTYKAFHSDEEFWDYYCDLLKSRYAVEGTIDDWARSVEEGGYAQADNYYKGLTDVYGTLGFV